MIRAKGIVQCVLRRPTASDLGWAPLLQSVREADGSLSPLEVFAILDVLTENGVDWPDDLAEFDPGYVIQDLGAEQRLPAKSKIAVQSMVRMAVMRRRACESLRIGQPRRKFVYRKKASPMPASPTKQAQPAIIIGDRHGMRSISFSCMRMNLAHVWQLCGRNCSFSLSAGSQ